MTDAIAVVTSSARAVAIDSELERGATTAPKSLLLP
jgi:hypothetical protein